MESESVMGHRLSVLSPGYSCASGLLLFFFNDTATTEIYTLSLHDALPIWPAVHRRVQDRCAGPGRQAGPAHHGDRKSTRLNSSHVRISYAVFCLKKKKHKSWSYPINPNIGTV